MRARTPGPGTILAVATLLLVGGAAQGRQEDPGSAVEKRREAVAAAVRRLAAFGKWCQGRSLRVLSRQQSETVLRLDPDNADARRALGHRRENGKWTAPVYAEPLADPVSEDGSDITLVERQMEAAYAEAAAPFAALAGWCAAADLDAEARTAWSDALFLDPARKDARAALGLGKADTAWLIGTEEGPANFSIRCRRLAGEGLQEFLRSLTRNPELVETRKTEDGTMAEEKRFSASSTLPDASARALVEDMVHAESLWRGLGFIPPRGPDPLRLRMDAVRSKEEFVALIDAVPGVTAEWRESKKQTGGAWVDGSWKICWGWDAHQVRESVSHNTAHFFFDQAATWGVPAWLREGSAMFTTTTLRARAESFCVVLRESAVDREMSGRENWDAATRALVLRGEDPPIGELVAARVNDLGRPMLLKSRSLVAWMALRSPTALRALLVQSTKTNTPASALTKAFGAPPEALERRWRLWIRRP